VLSIVVASSDFESEVTVWLVAVVGMFAIPNEEKGRVVVV
jgi:hypothetical protein